MYKFLRLDGKKIKSNSGKLYWKIGEWQHVEDRLVICNRGLHASKKIFEAFSYVPGEVLARVEVKGKHIDEKDKSVYSDMRIIEAYKWTKKDSVALSIFAAELCLKEFEKLYPDDKRPREAIEAARAVLAHDTAKNRSDAWSAARSAESDAWSAARSAESAAWSAWSARSAWSAAESAAWSAARSAARSAAESAWSSAGSAAGSAAINKIEKWFKNHIKEMEKTDNGG